jgi:threonine aldolase
VRNLDDGTLDLDDLESKVRSDNCHFPVTRLVCVENTHNYKGGRVIKPEYMDKLAAVAKKYRWVGACRVRVYGLNGSCTKYACM